MRRHQFSFLVDYDFHDHVIKILYEVRGDDHPDSQFRKNNERRNKKTLPVDDAVKHRPRGRDFKMRGMQLEAGKFKVNGLGRDHCIHCHEGSEDE